MPFTPGRRTVLAVDVPWGLDGATGKVRGVAVEAAERASPSSPQARPSAQAQAVWLCGAIGLADIGIPGKRVAARSPASICVDSHAVLWRGGAHMQPNAGGHKYSRRRRARSPPVRRIKPARLGFRRERP